MAFFVSACIRNVFFSARDTLIVEVVFRCKFFKLRNKRGGGKLWENYLADAKLYILELQLSHLSLCIAQIPLVASRHARLVVT